MEKENSTSTSFKEYTSRLLAIGEEDSDSHSQSAPTNASASAIGNLLTIGEDLDTVPVSTQHPTGMPMELPAPSPTQIQPDGPTTDVQVDDQEPVELPLPSPIDKTPTRRSLSLPPPPEDDEEYDSEGRPPTFIPKKPKNRRDDDDYEEEDAAGGEDEESEDENENENEDDEGNDGEDNGGEGGEGGRREEAVREPIQSLTPEEKANIVAEMAKIESELPKAKVPESIVDPENYTRSEFMAFLRFNQNFESVTVQGPPNTVKPEVFLSGIERKDHRELSEREGESRWPAVKNTLVFWNNKGHPNPLKSRLSHGVHEFSDLNGLDEKIIEDGGWSMETILRYEDLQRQLIEAGAGPAEHLSRKHKSKLSIPLRELFYMQSSECWNVNTPADSTVATKALNFFLNSNSTRNLTTLNPLNCFYLRAPSFTFHHPYRKIQTPAFAICYETELRHTLNAERNNYRTKMRGRNGSTIPKSITRISAPIRKDYLGFFKENIPRGFRKGGINAFCKDDGVKEKAKAKLLEMEAKQRNAANLRGEVPETFRPWATMNSIKAELWNALGPADKETWNQAAKKSTDGEVQYDRSVEVEAGLSTIANACDFVSRRSGFFSMHFSTFTMEDGTHAVSIEAGGTAKENLNFHLAYPEQYAAIMNCMKEIIAIKTDTDARLVRTDAICIKDGENKFVRSSGTDADDSVDIDEPTFTKEMTGKALVQSMQKWFVASLEKINGFKLAKKGNRSFNAICREQHLYFVNPPSDPQGHPVTLQNFAAMPEVHLHLWRDLLVDSFSQTSSENLGQFRFLRGDGSQPALTVLHMGSATKKAEAPSRKRKIDGTDGQKPKGKKRKSKVFAEDSAESSGEFDQKAQPVEPRPAGLVRGAGAKAKAEIAKNMARLNEEEELVAEEGRARKAAASTPASAPTSRPPGSDAQLKLSSLRIAATSKVSAHGQPNEVSYYLQLPRGMESSTLPSDWQKAGWSSDKAFAILLRHRRACYYSIRSLKELNARLPPLFPGISPRTSSRLPIRHPDLFQLYAHIYLGHHALKLTDSAFPDEVFLPEVPSLSGTAKEGFTCILLNSLYDCNFEIANPFRMGGMMIPDSCVSEAVSILSSWLDSSLTTLGNRSSLVGGKFEPICILQMIRAFCFITASEKLTEISGWDRYQQLLNVLTATVVFRYTRLVLTPLVKTIFSERAKFIPRIRVLVQNMIKLVDVFNRYWIATMADRLQVETDFMFTGIFPGFDLSEVEAEALTTNLHDLPFLSANAKDFPRLPLASRNCPLTHVLSRIPLKECWPRFQAWDRFLCVFVAISAAAPFINTNGHLAKPELTSEYNINVLDSFITNIIALFKLANLNTSTLMSDDEDILSRGIQMEKTASPTKRSLRQREKPDYIFMHTGKEQRNTPTLKRPRASSGEDELDRDDSDDNHDKGHESDDVFGTAKKKPKAQPTASAKKPRRTGAGTSKVDAEEVKSPRKSARKVITPARLRRSPRTPRK